MAWDLLKTLKQAHSMRHVNFNLDLSYDNLILVSDKKRIMQVILSIL